MLYNLPKPVLIFVWAFIWIRYLPIFVLFCSTLSLNVLNLHGHGWGGSFYRNTKTLFAENMLQMQNIWLLLKHSFWTSLPYLMLSTEISLIHPHLTLIFTVQYVINVLNNVSDAGNNIPRSIKIFGCFLHVYEINSWGKYIYNRATSCGISKNITQQFESYFTFYYVH